MSELAKINVSELSPIIEQIASFSTAQLKEELAKSMLITAEHLLRMAAIVKLLEERGEDLSDLRYGMMGYLRRIACGQMLPEVVVKFQGQPLLLNRIASLPIPDQQKILASDTIRIATLTVDNEPDARHVPLLQLSRDEIHQVFASDHIRDESEQLTYSRRKDGKKPKAKSQEGVRVDTKRLGIEVNGVFISRSELANYLARLS